MYVGKMSVTYHQDISQIGAFIAKFTRTPQNAGKINKLSRDGFPRSTAAQTMIPALKIVILTWECSYGS